MSCESARISCARSTWPSSLACEACWIVEFRRCRSARRRCSSATSRLSSASDRATAICFSAAVARIACQVLTAIPATRARATRAPVVRRARFRRAYFANR
ncbi:MAG: hypothetical protein ABS79_04140 [Planctomycetes bacterium SCN 63-9]|nr:MAG: hypothetical protein ABS79_04140 [Planctomycetes bacterium SCN 63-9]